MNTDEVGKRKPTEEAANAVSDQQSVKRPRKSDEIARDVKSPEGSSSTANGLPVPNAPEEPQSQEESLATPNGDAVGHYVELPALPEDPKPLTPLTNAERKELERYLDHTKDDTWREDWMGNLNFADADILNPDGKSRERSKNSLFNWAERGKISRKLPPH